MSHCYNSDMRNARAFVASVAVLATLASLRSVLAVGVVASAGLPSVWLILDPRMNRVGQRRVKEESAS